MREEGREMDETIADFEQELLGQFKRLNASSKEDVIAALLMFLSAQEGTASDRL